MSLLADAQSHGNPGAAPPQIPGQTAQPNAQQAFDKFVMNGLKILHTPEVADGVIQRVQSNPDKIEAIGISALDVAQRLETSASQSGFQTTANTVLHGLNVIVGEVINIAEAAGLPPLEDEQKFQAFSWAISNYISNGVKAGKITKEGLVRLGQTLSQKGSGKVLSEQLGGLS